MCSFCPKRPPAETTLALEGPARVGLQVARAIYTPVGAAYVTSDSLHSNSRNSHPVNINSDTFDK